MEKTFMKEKKLTSFWEIYNSIPPFVYRSNIKIFFLNKNICHQNFKNKLLLDKK